jgi:bifunctional UDP-N-acetylglucosamine pyrophosphorylase/glucosamine-1-phosphate N-acetyltransferase
MSQNTQLTVVILAAGKGTRMKSTKAKVLHEVFYRPMLHHVLDAVKPLKPYKTVVIVGHQEDTVRNALNNCNVTIVKQAEQLGTGHAVKMTEPVIPEDDGLVMILNGDSPLIRSISLQDMLDQHNTEQTDITVMTTILDNPTGYGRIISDDNSLIAIVEEKETTDQQKQIKEINSGIYLVNRNILFKALAEITSDNTQGEFYLTDIVGHSVSRGLAVHKFLNPCPTEVLGINSRLELESAHRVLQQQRNTELMQEGITMHNCTTISVSSFAKVGCDTLLMQNVQIYGNSVIGESCIIENGAVITDCTIGDNVHIGSYSVLKECQITDNTVIPPLTNLTME